MKRFFVRERPNGALTMEVNAKAPKHARDVKLVETQRNTVSKSVNKYRFQSPGTRTPQEEIERSRHLLKPKETPLTVGDLSIPSREKKKTSADPYVGPKTSANISNLFVGTPRVIRPALSESQRLNEKRIEAWKQKRREVMKMRQLVFEMRAQNYKNYVANYLCR